MRASCRSGRNAQRDKQPEVAWVCVKLAVRMPVEAVHDAGSKINFHQGGLPDQGRQTTAKGGEDEDDGREVTEGMEGSSEL